MFGAGDGDPGEARRIEILRASRRRASARLAEDAELRAALASVADLAFVSGAPSGRTTTLDYMRAAFSRYADRPCLGERRLVPASDGGSPVLLPEFQTRSYGEIWARASQLASAWAHQAIVAPGDRIALAGFASIDLVVAELACLQRGAVVIPLQTSASPEDLAHIVDEAGARWLIASCAALPSMLTALSACSSIEGTILIDAPDEAATALGKVHTIDALESLGRVRGLVEPARPPAASCRPIPRCSSSTPREAPGARKVSFTPTADGSTCFAKRSRSRACRSSPSAICRSVTSPGTTRCST